MRPRPAERAIEEQHRKEREHVENMHDTFCSFTPSQYLNHSYEEVQEGWGGTLDRGGQVAIKRYIANGGKGFMLLQGSSGVGKSTLAATIAAQLIFNTGLAAKFKNAPMLLSEFSFRDAEVGNPVKTYSEIPILVLDDLGAANEGITPHQQRSLWALIENRWSNNESRTIITSNMSVNDNKAGIGLSSWLGHSAWDRVSDNLTRVELKGNSFRGHKTA